jgi:hypothetical protein
VLHVDFIEHKKIATQNRNQPSIIEQHNKFATNVHNHRKIKLNLSEETSELSTWTTCVPQPKRLWVKQVITRRT